MILKKPYRQFLILLRDFGILILIGNFLSLFTQPLDTWDLQMVLRNCLFSILVGYPSWKGMGYIVAVLERKLPWLKFPIKRMVAQVVSMTLFAGLVIFLGMGIWFWISEELSFRVTLPYIWKPLLVAYIFLIVALFAGNSILFFKKWKEATIQQEELKRAHLALQYQSLRDQVRPHFLFNSLSSLVTLINTDADKATLFVHKLSDVYRYLLDQRETELVPLVEEMRFLEDYIFLQKIRFGENLRVTIQLEPVQKRMVIPLSLQMIVENAIKHNEVSASHPLTIEIGATDKGEVVITNTLKKKNQMEKSPGLGIENLRKRIEFFTSEPLLVEQGEELYRVTIPTIPS
jgi:sensor histidine kinase YesM